MADTTIEEIFGSSLLAYWHASDLAVGNGNAVSDWPDRKNSISMLQATGGLQPLQIDNYASSGYPAAQFDGTDDYLITTDASLNVTKYAILAAVKQNTAAAADTVYAVGSSGYCRLMANSSTIGDFRLQETSLSTSGAASGSSGINVVAGRCQADGYLWIENGPSVGSLVGSTTITASATHYMGCRPGPSQYFDGGVFAIAFVDLAECAWYDVIKGLVQMRSDFGLAIYDPLPQAPAGGTSGFTGIRGVGALGT